MANAGKYFDRNPCVIAAGVVNKSNGGTGDVLKTYNIDEAAECVLKKLCKEDRKIRNDLYHPRSPFIPHENIKDLLETELKKSRFVAFREKFSEDMFFKKPALGEVYPLHSKPDDVTNETTTFGNITEPSDALYQLILPPLSPDEVNRRHIQWHDKYVLSHKHYFPSERVNRHYDRRNFNPVATFGIQKDVDITGKNVKRILTDCDRLIVINKAQRGFLERSRGRLGRQIKKYDYNIPEDMTFGQASENVNSKCDVKALIENIDPCVKKTKLIESISHINKLRRILFSRINFHIHDLKFAMEKRDIENTGYLSLPKIFEAARSLFIRMDEEKIRTAAQLFGLLIDEGLSTERISYEQFLKILQIQYPLPKTGNISTMPDNIYNKDTTYRELCRDMHKKPIEALQADVRRQFPTEVVTTAKDLISPDIPLQFGLDHRDFEIRRSKEELRRIFKQVIADDSKFDEIWGIAKSKLKAENYILSVDDLRPILNSFN